MGLKTIEMGWDLCSSPPWVPFYPYTMFQNPISRPSCQKWRKTITTQKVLVTQSSNIMHCDWHTQNLYVQIFKPLWTLFPCWIWCFFIFCQGEFRNAWMSVWPTVSPNVMMTWHSTALDHQMPIPGVQFLKNYNFRQTFHILLILTEKNALKLLEWCVFRVQGVPNPMAPVLSLYDM